MTPDTEKRGEHTPTPWIVWHESPIYVCRDFIDKDGHKAHECLAETFHKPGIASANAEFIVRAVNEREELLACLKHAAENYTPKAWAILGEKEVEWQKRSLAAIAKAEANPSPSRERGGE